MPIARRKLSAAVRDFRHEMAQLERFDAENQSNFSSAIRSLSKKQLHFLTEAIFFRAFRSFEGFTRDIFLLYCMGKRTLDGSKVVSHLKPSGFFHAEILIRSSMRFLDWANPDTLIERSEIYLKEGFPIKLPVTSSRESLHDFRKIRNHIAHDSKESLDGYKSVLRRHFRTVPLSIPSPGEFLLVSDRVDPTKYKLLVFFEQLKNLASDLTIE